MLPAVLTDEQRATLIAMEAAAPPPSQEAVDALTLVMARVRAENARSGTLPRDDGSAD